MKQRFSLFKKIFIFSVGAMIFTVILSSLLNIAFAEDFYIYRLKKEITIIKEKAKEKYLTSIDDYEEYTDRIMERDGINITVYNKNLHRRFPHPPILGRALKFDKNPPRMDWAQNEFHISSRSKSKVKILFYLYPINDDEIMVLSTSLTFMENLEREIQIFAILTVLISLIASMIISRFFSRNITKKLDKLNKVAKKISALDFSEKSEIKSSDELGELSQSIDRMADDLEISIENLKSFASNASHELRTPIAVISANSQALLSNKDIDNNQKLQYYKSISRKATEMNEIIGNLLAISRLSSPKVAINKENIKLIDLIHSSQEKYENLELQKDIEWRVMIDTEELYCDEKLMGIAINNIVQNALKYAPSETEIEIYSLDNEIYFENKIEDNIESDVDKLWEPFYRGINARENSISGTGLGLSIVQKILETNGYVGEIKVKEDKFIFILKKEAE